MLNNVIFFILILPQLLISIILAESSSESLTTVDSIVGDNNNDCHCASEEIFDSNLNYGRFKSPGYPEKYCGSLDCKWNILPEKNTFVSATLEENFEIDNHDFLEVYQTKWNGSTLIKVLQASISGGSSYLIVGYRKHRYFSSSINGGLLFHFVTDNTEHNYRGFEIHFFRKPANSDPSFSPCPQPFYFASNSTQYLPTFSNIMEACIFSINSTKAVKLTIKKFDSSMFQIEGFETESFPKPYVEKQGGQLAKIERHSFNTLPLTVTSRTESMSVLITVFHTENDPYEIEFIAAKSVCECFPDNLIVSRVQPLNLLAPGFPEYCDNLNCSTQISLENPLSTNQDVVEALQIKFNSFQTEVDNDLLHLLLPFGNERRELISFGGDAKEIKLFSFNSASFTLNFTTDSSNLFTGFNLTIEAIKIPKECLCHGTDSNLKILNGKKYSVQNHYNAEKCSSMDCFWKIEPLKDSKFNYRLLVKLNLSLGGSTEFVEACHGDFHESNPNCHRIDAGNVDFENKLEFTNGHIPSLSSLKQMDPIYIWYHREFEEYSKIHTLPNISRQINFTYEWREECKCGNIHLKASINDWSVLYSPDHPETYCPSMHCIWLIEAPEGYHLVVNISEFYTEANHDFLTIFDGSDISQKHMEMLSGMITFKYTIKSQQNKMSILFTSDLSIQMSGFVLHYKAVPNDEFLQEQQLITILPSSTSNNNSSPHRLLLFMFFILFAIIGILFFVASTNNRIATIENIFRQLWPSGWIRMFSENEGEGEGGRNQVNNNLKKIRKKSEFLN